MASINNIFHYEDVSLFEIVAAPLNQLYCRRLRAIVVTRELHELKTERDFSRGTFMLRFKDSPGKIGEKKDAASKDPE